MLVIYVISADKGNHSCELLTGLEYRLLERVEVDALFYTREDTSMYRWLPIRILVSGIALALTS